MDSPAKLLAAVADALNACERAGVPVQLARDAVWTRHGYVLHSGDPRIGSPWAARMPLSPREVANLRVQSGNWTSHRCRAADDSDLTAEQEIVLGMLRKETRAMSEQPEDDPEACAALEPVTQPHPLRAQDVEPLIQKEIALPMSQVRLNVSGYLLLQVLFRLPDDVTLEGASVERDGDEVKLLLTVDFPDAPPGAASVDLTYTRRTALPDPVQLTGIRWLREDGSEIKPDPVQPGFQTTTQVVEQAGIKPQEMMA